MKTNILRSLVVALAALLPQVALTGKQNPPDPKQFTETVRIISKTKESVDQGSTVKTRRIPPSILHPKEKVESVVTPHVVSFYQVKVQIGDMLYTINGRGGAPGVPFGTFKAKITNQ
jgi:hypothetical protein